jgi:hypothetical protein
VFQPTTTIDEMLATRSGGLDRSHVSEPGFALLYARVMGSEPCVLTLADITAEIPGAGALTRLLDRLARDWPDVIVRIENVGSPRLVAYLERRGFESSGGMSPSLWLHPHRRRR